VRLYAPYLLAEVTVQGDMDKALSGGWLSVDVLGPVGANRRLHECVLPSACGLLSAHLASPAAQLWGATSDGFRQVPLS
jgi:hypothetical protein